MCIKKYLYIISLVLIIFSFIISFIICCKFNKNSTTGTGNKDFSIHFLELGNKYTGDSIYINYGEIDIIIDAGSRTSSAATICQYINQYTKDAKLEYVIVTHGDQDHISGFVGDKNTTGIFDYYKIGTIIDFPQTNKTTTIYNNYQAARDRAVQKGAIHYNALQCFNNENGAKRIYDLGGNVKMEILYNYYYENNSNDENNYSVCIIFHEGDNKYLFTGDLEKDGEAKLVDYYEQNFGGLGHCKLFKAGHHGSYTATTDKLLKTIKPEYVVITCAAGTSEYTKAAKHQFPAQEVIERIAQYTDKVYVTTKIINYNNNKFESLNGNIVFKLSDGGINCSDNNIKLKDSKWFIDFSNNNSDRVIPNEWK